LAPTASDRNALTIPSSKLTTTQVKSAFNPQEGNAEAALLGKKTLRDSQSDVLVVTDETHAAENDLLFSKFANTQNPNRRSINMNNGNSLAYAAGISEFKSKTSANFYLYLNKKNSEKTYLNIKNKKDDEKRNNEMDIISAKKTELKAEKDKKSFSIKFGSSENIEESNVGNLDLKDFEDNKDKCITARINFDEEDYDEEEISIPDII